MQYLFISHCFSVYKCFVLRQDIGFVVPVSCLSEVNAICCAPLFGSAVTSLAPAVSPSCNVLAALSVSYLSLFCSGKGGREWI